MVRTSLGRLMAAMLSSAIAMGLVVDIVDEYATEAPDLASVVERPAITSPQLDGQYFVMETSTTTYSNPAENASQQASQPAIPAAQPVKEVAN